MTTLDNGDLIAFTKRDMYKLILDFMHNYKGYTCYVTITSPLFILYTPTYFSAQAKDMVSVTQFELSLIIRFRQCNLVLNCEHCSVEIFVGAFNCTVDIGIVDLN